MRIRYLHRLILSSRWWRRRLIFWCGALLIGVFASYFALVMDHARNLFDHWVRPYPYMPLALTPLGFSAISWLTLRYAPAARGSGIPQAIAARIQRAPADRVRLLGWKTVLIKFLLVPAAILVGASVGREGPTVQIGAGIMFYCATLGKVRRQRGIVLAGAAAGVAAAFNTPLAGIMFAIEEMARAFEYRNSAIVLIAIVLAGAASMSILGNYDYFGYTHTTLSLSNGAAVLVVALFGGIFGGLFSRVLTHGEPYLRHLGGGLGFHRPVAFAALCGLLVALIGIATEGATYGSGYEMGSALLHQHLAAAWWLMPAKLAATAISAISGIPGGIFSPSLSVGAALGAEIGHWFPGVSAPGMVLLGMVAYFAGVAQAPITAFVIVLEITGEATSALPLMAAAVVASGISRQINHTSLYHSLAKNFITMEKAPHAATTSH